MTTVRLPKTRQMLRRYWQKPVSSHELRDERTMKTSGTSDATTATPEAERPTVEEVVQRLRRIRRLSLRRGRVFDTSPFVPEPATAPAAEIETAMPRAGLRVHPTHRLEGFELRSVTRAALRYYACAFAALSVGVTLLWFGASMLGIVGRIEEFMRSIGFRGFHFAGFAVIVGGILLSVAAVAFLTVMTVLAAAFYNLLVQPDRGVGVRLAAIPPVAVEPPSPQSGTTNGNGNGNGARKAKTNGNGNGTSNGSRNGSSNGNRTSTRRRVE
jgi:hypothetical protein